MVNSQHFRPIFREPKGILTNICEQSDQLYFVYTGSARGLMINPAIFLEKTELWKRNLIILQDPWTVFYQLGISDEVNSFEAFLQWHDHARNPLTHVKRVFCLGPCMGGYAALAFGHLLAVEEVWAFSPVTLLPDRLAPRTPDVVAPQSGVLSTLADTGSSNTSGTAIAGTKGVTSGAPSVVEIPAERRDLSLALKTGNGVTRYNVFYNETSERDTDEAMRIADCENVKLWPQPGEGHDVVQTLLDLDLLSSTVLPHNSR